MGTEDFERIVWQSGDGAERIAIYARGDLIPQIKRPDGTWWALSVDMDAKVLSHAVADLLLAGADLVEACDRSRDLLLDCWHQWAAMPIRDGRRNSHAHLSTSEALEAMLCDCLDDCHEGPGHGCFCRLGPQGPE